jgi:hypothetical protein
VGGSMASDPCPPGSRKTLPSDRRLIERYEAVGSVAATARSLGVSAERVRVRLNELGVETKSRSRVVLWRMQRDHKSGKFKGKG